MKTSSKIRVGLLAALVALGLSALPTAAQATTQQAPIGTALKAGAPFKMQTNSLRAWTKNEEGNPGPSLVCPHGELTGEVISNGVEKPTNKINGSKFSNCIIGGAGGGEEWKADVSSNAKENPWTLEFQQPKGTYFAHLLPAPGNKLRIKVQVQIEPLDFTCVYASESSNPLTPFNFFGKENTNVLETVFNVFELQSGLPALCGVSMTTEANYEMTSGGNALYVDEK